MKPETPRLGRCPCGRETTFRCACGGYWCEACVWRHTGAPRGRCAEAVRLEKAGGTK